MKHFTSIVLLLTSAVAIAQFPEKKPDLLIGHEVKVLPFTEHELTYTTGYEHFHTDPELKSSYYASNGKGGSKIEALSGRVFKVTDVKHTTGLLKTDYYDLKLEGNGETIYYDYSEGYSNPLEPQNFTLPDDYYCLYVAENTSADTGTHYEAEVKYNFEISRTIKGNKNSYMLYLETDWSAKDNTKGLTVALENNKKILRPKQPISQTGSRSPHYFAFFELTPAEVELLKQNRILSYVMDGHPKTLSENHSKALMGALNCIAKK